MEMRPHQSTAVRLTYEHFKNNGMNGLIVHATGTGKSHIIAQLCADSYRWGKRVLVLAHVKELLQQNHNKLIPLLPGVPVGIYSAGLGQKTMDQITIAGIQSIHGLADTMEVPDLVIVDEAHRTTPKQDTTYGKLLATLRQRNPRIRIIGLTATPFRTKGGSLLAGDAPLFTHIIHTYGIKQGVEDGFLAPLVSKRSLVQADMKGVTKVAGEFNQKQMAERFHPELTRKAVADMLGWVASRKSLLIFSANVDHGEYITELLQAIGWPVAMVHGDTKNRGVIFDKYKRGELRALVGCEVFTTGFDAPNTDCIVMLRSTASPGLYVQILGRGTRLSPETGKTDCLFLDYGGNYQRFGPVDLVEGPDEKKKRDITVTPMKLCPVEICQQPNIIQARVCEHCGTAFPYETPKAIHGTIADDADPMGRDREFWVTVKEWSHTLHQSRQGNICIKVTYYCEGMRRFQEYFMPEATGKPRMAFEAWWMRLKEQNPPRNNALVLHRLKTVQIPTRIRFRKDGDFFKSIAHDYSGATGSNARGVVVTTTTGNVHTSA
jgi:DNA repair protein RadD